MALADRIYSGKGGSETLAKVTPVVKGLLILNIGLFVLDYFFKAEPPGPIRLFGAFTIESAFQEMRIWKLITFQFIHGSIAHVLFNSIALFFFGPWMERWWGASKFLVFYLLSGVGGGLFFTLLASTGILPREVLIGIDEAGRQVMQPMAQIPLVGASAGIYGILVGVAVIAPTLRVSLLFPPITLTMRQLAMVLMAIAVGSILLKLGGNEGGEAGHLGGAIVGYILIRAWIWRSQTIMDAGFGRFPTNFGRGPRTDIPPKIRPRTIIDLRSQTEIDTILEKISSEGFQSLTPEERDTLHRAAQSEKD